jgi:hypothetical protein
MFAAMASSQACPGSTISTRRTIIPNGTRRMSWDATGAGRDAQWPNSNANEKGLVGVERRALM